jgi:ElaB/YqjD/DUF883 family membrane-anchored ribosome-binding protein
LKSEGIKSKPKQLVLVWLFYKFRDEQGDLKMAETQETNNEQGLVKPEIYNGEDTTAQNDYVGEFKAQAQEYGQRFNDAALKAKDYASEKFEYASEKIKELQAKDPKELIEDAKEYARQKPAQTILISAAVGLVLGLLLKRR